ncbi:MAG: hypothetical protein KF819_15905 [Labilithrix sp.]|nr:hypothetical protein [Labilithrix sp.]
MKRVVFALSVAGVCVACGAAESDAPLGPTGSDAPAASSPSSPSPNAPSTPGDPPAPGPSAPAPVDVSNASCSSAIPASGPRALALPTYAGTCPALTAAPGLTTITSSGAQRKFIAVKPQAIAPGEKLPVVFLWHWLGGSPEKMAEVLEVQTAVDARRFIAVIPDPKGDGLFRWPFEAARPQARVDEEAVFFDDMLACVAASLPANKECVSSIGISAGALWTAQLGVARSERLSSIVSLSGGVGNIVRPWSTTPHRLPALVLWGGPSDVYPESFPLVNFNDVSNKLVNALATDNHFVVECTHNCGHDVPPFDPPAAGALQFDVVWRFVLDHPYWLGAAESPYASKALPAVFPSWCGKGKGSAVARTAACL